MDLSMVQACGKEKKVTVMWVSGEWERPMDMEFMYGSMGIAMKDSSSNV